MQSPTRAIRVFRQVERIEVTKCAVWTRRVVGHRSLLTSPIASRACPTDLGMVIVTMWCPDGTLAINPIQNTMLKRQRQTKTLGLLALNIDLASVVQAGRWKTTVTPMRYGKEVQAGRGDIAA